MNNRSIGVFDSGVGGLTVLKQLENILPDENFIYFGDTARIPYGEKTPEQIDNYVDEIIEWFITQKVKAVVMACNTSSAISYEKIKNKYDFPVFSLIEPASRFISSINETKIGVIATSATVNSHAYKKNIQTLNAQKIVYEIGCPGLVEIVESNKIETPEAKRLVEKYVNPLIEQGVEKIILGCTHYPFLRGIISSITGNDNMLIDPAEYLAVEVAKTLKDSDCLNSGNIPANRQFFASSNPLMFKEAGKRFYPNIESVTELKPCSASRS